MRLETFFENFELLADAPNGVQKLRELILELAVRGKLVLQDQNDEPASVLLEKIKAKKEWLIQEKKLKKSKPLPAINENKLPYELPKNWKWVQLDDISDIGTGSTPLTSQLEYYEKGNIPWITSAATSQHFIQTAAFYITPLAISDYRLRIYSPGTLIVALYGQGKTRGQVSQLKIAATINQACAAISFFEASEELGNYVRQVFKKKYDELRDLAAGGAQPNLNVGKIKETLIPLPPLEEQKRIVAKVDQLMSLCDRLEERQQKRRTQRILLNNAALEQLLGDRQPEEFSKHWRRICNNFDLLYSTPENIGKLRQAILQLAVQGKLVPQDSNDEPASVLLEKIQFEKEQLVKEGKIQKSKLLPLINYDEIPFELPAVWKWERLNNLCEQVVDCLHSTPNFLEQGKLCIDTTCLSQGKILFDKLRKVSEDTFIERTRRLKPRAGDVLFSREGTIGLSVVVPEGLELCLGQRMMMFRTFRWILPEYFRYVLTSNMFVNQWQRKLIGTAAHHVNIGDLKTMLIPLPPVNEQKRIVAKVDELMTLCDELETKLTQSVTNSEKLMDAAVRQLF